MKLYANNIEVKFKERPIVQNRIRYQEILEKWDDDVLNSSLPTLILEMQDTDIINVLKMIIDGDVLVSKQLTFVVRSKREFKKVLKVNFNTVKAAGGIVEKEDLILVIKRHGLWDIAKGKLEKGEDIEEAAVREVEEECGVKVSLLDKIGKTRHLYRYKGAYALKLTHWYRMSLVSDKGMQPQVEEGITAVKWMSKTQVMGMKTYSSIIGLLEKYYRS